MTRKTLNLLFMTLWMGHINAQSISPEVVSSSGDTFQGTTMQIDWTLGELVVTTDQNPLVMVTQGFHQPNYIITSVSELPQEIGAIEVFPNPTSDWVNIHLNLTKNRTIQVQLIDWTGKLIWSKNNQGLEITEKFDLGELPSGIYLLNFLIDKDQYFKTFKIQKI